MYAVLNFSAGWISHLGPISKAITSLVCGASLSSVQASHLASTNFNIAKSFRRATDANHFWIQDTDNICHSPCDTPTAQNKYARIVDASTNIAVSLGTNLSFTNLSTSYCLRSASAISNSFAISIHVYCTKKAIVISSVQENGSKPAVTCVLSEITYDLMPYMDDATGSFVPAVLGEFGYNPLFAGSSSGDSDDPFHCPNVVTNIASGASAIMTTTDWVVGNASTAYNPLSRALGTTRLSADGNSSVEAFLPLGVCSSSNTILFVGSITEKSGIMITNGVGHPVDSTNAPNCMSPDTILELNGVDYFILDRLLVPYV